MMRDELTTERDREILDHYFVFFPGAVQIYSYHAVESFLDGPLHVVEIGPETEEEDWRYLTVGMSRKPMPAAAADEHRAELLLYSSEQRPELADALAGLASYPFEYETNLGVGHTIAGEAGQGIVPGSPLTEILLTPVYFEDAGFDTWQVSDGTHVQVLWVTPIHTSEREFILKHGWRALVEGPFIEQELDAADLFRGPVA